MAFIYVTSKCMPFDDAGKYGFLYGNAMWLMWQHSFGCPKIFHLSLKTMRVTYKVVPHSPEGFPKSKSFRNSSIFLAPFVWIYSL